MGRLLYSLQLAGQSNDDQSKFQPNAVSTSTSERLQMSLERTDSSPPPPPPLISDPYVHVHVHTRQIEPPLDDVADPFAPGSLWRARLHPDAHLSDSGDNDVFWNSWLNENFNENFNETQSDRFDDSRRVREEIRAVVREAENDWISEPAHDSRRELGISPDELSRQAARFRRAVAAAETFRSGSESGSRSQVGRIEDDAEERVESSLIERAQSVVRQSRAFRTEMTRTVEELRTAVEALTRNLATL
ncbi:hypothetical protein GYMLUDRAFT_47089 [Collybiopsis luxurians FD-317 M1]|uniref:Uncharacterized protein n=1 Tax=Collybiopsis luxurians FD-317 M1 TaxID=944289 RepID=A0A0D0BMZ4_9AGAR|nr:hypothetical protein GYMLUDRAFT_47089 [Collybiopsis luxurians FD-317 M1]